MLALKALEMKLLILIFKLSILISSIMLVISLGNYILTGSVGNTVIAVSLGLGILYMIKVLEERYWSKDRIDRLLLVQRKLCAKELEYIKLESMKFPEGLKALQGAIINHSQIPGKRKYDKGKEKGNRNVDR